MTQSRDPIAVFEKVRELESEIGALLSGLDPDSPHPQENLKLTLLEIDVEGTVYLIPIDRAREVVSMAWPEPVPGAPDWVMGTISFGSEPTVLIDMAQRLHGRPTKLSTDLLIVVIDGPRWLGLVVSMVGNLRDVEPHQLTTPGPDLPCAAFLLGTVPDDSGVPQSVLSVGRLSRDLDGCSVDG